MSILGWERALLLILCVCARERGGGGWKSFTWWEAVRAGRLRTLVMLMEESRGGGKMGKEIDPLRAAREREVAFEICH